MGKVPNADDFLDNYNEEYCAGQVYGSFGYPRNEVTKAMIDFAKAHVQSARAAIMKEARTKFDQYGREVVDTVSIYRAYPTENIK